jgi:putative flippase GtrA
VIHNFIWHEQFTWADRVRPSWPKSLWRLARFNVTTGAVSIVGNLALMKVMVGLGGMNFLLANAVAIAVCSIVNFLISEKWVFGEATASSEAADIALPLLEYHTFDATCEYYHSCE